MKLISLWFNFLDRVFSFLFSQKKDLGPVAGIKETEIEVTVRRPDGSIKAYRKVINDKEVEKIDC